MGVGIWEYWNLGSKRIHPSFHPSTIPIFITLEQAIKCNEAYEVFSEGV
jgi:hypothetical protein